MLQKRQVYTCDGNELMVGNCYFDRYLASSCYGDVYIQVVPARKVMMMTDDDDKEEIIYMTHFTYNMRHSNDSIRYPSSVFHRSVLSPWFASQLIKCLRCGGIL